MFESVTVVLTLTLFTIGLTPTGICYYIIANSCDLSTVIADKYEYEYIFF